LDEFGEFNDLQQKARSELDNLRKIFLRRYDNLLKENLTESNIENFTKLLAMLKSEVDENLNRYNLHELRDNINLYFKFIKKLYTIISSYRVLNYNDASEKILNCVKDLNHENFPNLKSLILNIYQTLLLIQFEQMSEKFEKLTINEISEKLSIPPERIEDIINFIQNQPKNPIKKYVVYNKEVFFKR
jgi:O-acetylhomoserine/O-acetylserine sulfhydrylase-like pyridoxal-dependent enzyme